MTMRFERVLALMTVIWMVACGADASGDDTTSTASGGGASAGGTSATGGASVSGGAVAGGGAANDCVDVSGAGTQPWVDIRVTGSGFDAWNEERVRIVVALNPIDAGRFAIGHTTIEAGSFDLLLPESRNATFYTIVGLYIDADRDDACDPDEPLWHYTTGVGDVDMVLDVTPTEVCDSSFGTCLPWQSMEGSCNANGVDVLTPLSCTSR